MKKSIGLIALIYLLIIQAAFAKKLHRNFSISNENPAKNKISNITFPRLSEIKYRGVSPEQLDLTKALRAMLGDDTANIESILMTGIKLKLQGLDVPFYSHLQSIFTRRSLQAAINSEISKNNNKFFDEFTAAQLAVNIIEKSIKDFIWRSEFFTRYINYRSGGLEVFPKEVVFSTVYLEVANIYSKDIVVIDEKDDNQMLDLNYWNKVNNGSWVDTYHPWVDKGELITPIFIGAEKVQGFKQYQTQWPSHQVFRALQNQLMFAFYKDDKTGDVLVFDGELKGRLQQAIVMGKNNTYYYANSKFDSHAEVPKQLDLTSEKANLIGIIKLCSQKAKCYLQNQLLDKYPRSEKSISSDLIEAMKRVNFSGKTAKFFYGNYPINSDEIVSKNYEYENELNPRDYNHELALNDKEYSPTIFYSAPEIESNKLIYNFSDVQLNPKEALYLLVPESLRDKIIKSIKLVHRQDKDHESTPRGEGSWDKSPGYTAVEFHHASPYVKDKWRFWGGKALKGEPRGSLFAEQGIRMKVAAQTQESWDVHIGHDKSNASQLPPNFDSLRVLSIGSDPVFLETLEVEFK